MNVDNLESLKLHQIIAFQHGSKLTNDRAILLCRWSGLKVFVNLEEHRVDEKIKKKGNNNTNKISNLLLDWL